MKKCLLRMAFMVSFMFLVYSGNVFAAGVKVNSKSITSETFKNHLTITEVYIGPNVKNIEDGAFSNLKNLYWIDVDRQNPYFGSSKGCLYTKDFTTLVCRPPVEEHRSIFAYIIARWPHAVDGMPASRAAEVDKMISENLSSYGPYTGRVKNDGSTSAVFPDTLGNNTVDFSKYIYTDSSGKKVFKYTGSGNSFIIIPEGVEVIEGFTDDDSFNDEIIFVSLPSTLQTIRDGLVFRYTGEYQFYSVLYQCRNLQAVSGSGRYYKGLGNKVIQFDQLYTWHKDKKYSLNMNLYEYMNILGEK